ncbi:MAG: nucleotidyltransferase domain-containing protein [Planctomycetes bacterium]|nr:nucleotidyltransferase domain-containing protein [Planctomycetota bacterium]
MTAYLAASLEHPEVYLFGSRARGDHTTWSDYDLCVISRSFEDMAPWDRATMVLRGWKGHRPCEPVCYTPREFATSDYSLPQSIRSEGIRIA